MSSANSFILAIDQGTSGTKTLIFSEDGRPVAKGNNGLNSQYPKIGYVEQKPEEIYQTVLASVDECIKEFTGKGYKPSSIQTCGIANQRETFLLWDEAGTPLSPAVVWQCKRSVEICKRFKENGWEAKIRQRTGLPVDPYFSGSKLVWLAENDKAVQAKIEAGKAHFGTIDTWLLYRLTDGKRYQTDYTNASRTMLFNIHKLEWDSQLLDMFGLESLILPEVVSSCAEFGSTDFQGLLDQSVPIGAMAGDSHAAAFGERCYYKGTAKATLGTGCSILMNTGAELHPSVDGLIGTICWSTTDTITYGLEGAIVSCGSILEWLKNQLNLFEDTAEIREIAEQVESSEGVYLVPAFSGIGAPYWDMEARGVISGLTFGTSKNHIIRAALESIPFQIKVVIDTIKQATGIELKELNADGGISKNSFVMQQLADLLEIRVRNLGLQDVSALGAALLAGLQENIYRNTDELERLSEDKIIYTSKQETDQIKKSYREWKKRVDLELQKNKTN